MVAANQVNTTAAVRLLIVEDHGVVRQALHLLLSDPRYGIEVVGEAGDGVEAVALAQSLCPDVILMDLFMPRLGGIEATQAILVQNCGARILALTSDESQEIALAAIRAGALGVVHKRTSASELIHTLHAVAQDQLVISRTLAAALAHPQPAAPASLLTGRELVVLECLARGLSNQEIAASLKISTATVRSHISHLFQKLDATNRTQAVIHAADLGLLAGGLRPSRQ
jgi:DNA-binding NarL/FixJ family response regulator